MKSTLITVALCSACYSPAYQDCEVTCATSQACPSGYSCTAGFCVASASTSCTGAGMDGGMDATDARPPGAWSMPTPVQFVAGTPMGVDDDPSLSDDMLELYVNRVINTSGEVFSARRTDVTQAFSSPASVPGINSTLFEDTPEVSGDGLTLFFASTRSGGAGGSDIWMATRTATSAQYGPPVLMGAFNGPTDETGPALSRDGLSMVFASLRNGDFDIYLSNRTQPTPTAPWSSPMLMTAISMGGAYDESPFLSGDKLTLYFNSNRGGNHDLYQAKRASPTANFDPPEPITELNTPGNEGDPWVSADGKHIVFTRVIGGELTLMEATR
jgi:Tol biopolymer transport system component